MDNCGNLFFNFFCIFFLYHFYKLTYSTTDGVALVPTEMFQLERPHTRDTF